MLQSVDVVDVALPVRQDSEIHEVPQVVSPTGVLSMDQRAKLRSELDVVQSNMVVFGEMLSEMKPGTEQHDELELLQVTNICVLSGVVGLRCK